MSPKSLVMQAVRHKARVRRFSPRTERAYARWIRRFIRFHGLRHPRELGEPEVVAFLNHLAAERGVASSTQTQALCALLFCTSMCWGVRWGGCRISRGLGAARACRYC